MHTPNPNFAHKVKDKPISIDCLPVRRAVATLYRGDRLTGFGIVSSSQCDNPFFQFFTKLRKILGSKVQSLVKFHHERIIPESGKSLRKSTKAVHIKQLIGALEHLDLFSIQLGMSSSQLTHIFQRGRAQPPTRNSAPHPLVSRRRYKESASRCTLMDCSSRATQNRPGDNGGSCWVLMMGLAAWSVPNVGVWWCYKWNWFWLVTSPKCGYDWICATLCNS